MDFAMSEVNKPAPPTKLDNLPATYKPVMVQDGDAIARQLIEQGRPLFEKWNLPEVYKEVVTEHHDEELDTQNIVVALVRLAHLGCRKLGLGLGKYPEIVLPTTAEAEILRSEEISLVEFEIRLEDQCLAGKSAPASR
jgi:HD-like signal output (HDOD) protein